MYVIAEVVVVELTRDRWFCFSATLTGVTRKVEQNYLYGPTTKYLMSVGAKLSLCMRDDSATQVCVR